MGFEGIKKAGDSVGRFVQELGLDPEMFARIVLYFAPKERVK